MRSTVCPARCPPAGGAAGGRRGNSTLAATGQHLTNSCCITTEGKHTHHGSIPVPYLAYAGHQVMHSKYIDIISTSARDAAAAAIG